MSSLRCTTVVLVILVVLATVDAEAQNYQAPAAGRASTQDIVGLRLNVNRDEAKSLITLHDKRMVISQQTDVMDPPIGTEFVSVVSGLVSSVSPGKNPQSESIRVEFTNPTLPGGAVGIGRSLEYAFDAMPTVAMVVSALEEKYGKPDFVSHAMSASWFGWYEKGGKSLDEDTKRLCASAATQVATTTVPSSRRLPWGPAIVPCGITLGATISWPPGKKDYVHRFQVGLVDMVRAVEAGDEVQALRRGTHPASKAAAERARQEAEKAPKPKL